jgi:hypothetical protein
MADKKITDLTAIVNIANDDVLPIVDISDDTTKKINIAQLKAQSPVQSVAGKTGSVVLDASDIGAGSVDNTEYGYLNGVTSPIQTQLNTKQGTLALTTTGTSGAATLIGTTLNIPQYSGGGASGVSQIVAGTNVTISPVGGTGVVTINATGSGGTTWGSITGTLSNQTDLQTALDGKVDENAAITASTKTKITYDAKGLVTAGADLSASDMPSGIDAAKISTGLISNAEFDYLNGLTDNIQTQFTGKQTTLVSGTNIKTVNSNSLLGSGDVAVQATLVSGTNIKTINSTSLLGSGDISVAPATGINATAIADGSVTSTEFQYINSLTSNAQTQIDSKQATLVSGTNIKTINSTSLLGSGDIVIGGGSPSGVSGAIQFSDGSAFASDAANLFWDDTNNRLGIGTNTPSATGHFKGSGSTSATTALLVQNSAGTNALQIRDDRVTNFEVPVSINGWNIITSDAKIGITPYSSGLGTLFNSTTPNGGSYLPCTFWISNFFIEGTGGTQIANSTGSINASAKLQVDSTTKGFLPPRMTTTQKNAIASPAAGLVVYDNTTNKLCCYDGSTWNDLF